MKLIPMALIIVFVLSCYISIVGFNRKKCNSCFYFYFYGNPLAVNLAQNILWKNHVSVQKRFLIGSTQPPPNLASSHTKQCPQTEQWEWYYDANIN